MKNIAVFFGGRSAEHEVSIITGLQSAEQLDKSRYNVIPVYLARDGRWYSQPELLKIESYRPFKPEKTRECTLPPFAGSALRLYKKRGKFTEQLLDAAVLCLHGAHGEDGTLQGLFELCDLPYTSCGVTASGVCMDKIMMKLALRGAQLPVVADTVLLRSQWEADRQACLESVEAALSYPVFVKPACLGSSIGISCAADRAALAAAMDLACAYDRRILIEAAVAPAREVNCAAYGAMGSVRVSEIEEPLRTSEWLSYQDKYLSGGNGTKGGGMKSLKRKLPADLPDQTAQRVRELTQRAFLALDCRGVVRIDFLINETDEVFIEEINTIPGSLSFYLFEPLGMTYGTLLDELIDLALAAAKDKQRNAYAYQSDILSQYSGGSKGRK